VLVDAHCHLEPELPVTELLGAMDAAGVDRAVLLAAAQAPITSVPKAGAALFRGCVRLPGVGMAVYRAALRSKRVVPFPRPDNEVVFDAARAHAERFVPFAFLNPAVGAEAHDELDRRLASGAAGVKLHPWLHEYRLTDALPVLERAAAAGIPVLAHLGTGPAEDVEAVMDRLPRLKLVLAHAGIPHFERLWTLPGIRFDVAAPLVSRRTMRRLVRAVGPERVLYGSDAPIGIRGSGGHAYDLPPLPDRAMGQNLLDLLA
jgi:predicted TIM-barrel fold metal-dependent hydrolase